MEPGVKPQLLQIPRLRRHVKKAHHDLFAVHRGESADPHIGSIGRKRLTHTPFLRNVHAISQEFRQDL